MNTFKNLLSVAAGMAGLMFVGYCVYFDKKRRSDPNFKKKLHARRLEAQKVEDENTADAEDLERYFLGEIELGEYYTLRGDFEKAVEHLTNALIVCGQRDQIMQILQSALPVQAHDMLIQKLQEKSIPYEQASEAADNQEDQDVTDLLLEYISATHIPLN